MESLGARRKQAVPPLPAPAWRKVIISSLCQCPQLVRQQLAFPGDRAGGVCVCAHAHRQDKKQQQAHLGQPQPAHLPGQLLRVSQCSLAVPQQGLSPGSISTLLMCLGAAVLHLLGNQTHSSPHVLGRQDLPLVAVGALELTQEQGTEWPLRLGFGDTAAIICLAEGLIRAGSKVLARA